MDEPLAAVATPFDTGASTALSATLDGWTDPDGSTPIEILALLKAIARLEQVVDQETQSLRAGETPAFEDLNYRKSHGLLELTRAMRLVDPLSIGDDLRDRLESFREQLERNRMLLKTHLDATREISAILTAAISDAESDGTYAPPQRLWTRPQ
ncbi:flagellar protein FlgN [Pleomorphomonas sp. NRK KF1]|uniref:flagellar protein FlgN n=1 Tax=Pleomorphomonas sp. NRK KF1 TaxID=2943000 RepID=UPI0020439737|nr:flagellar protein FlgN [Pleomorphomonas sp. NRK KF1]MCM5552044.1 flagellar protein FlgN [Pleomorphomonas sp. NRK KF1]